MNAHIKHIVTPSLVLSSAVSLQALHGNFVRTCPSLWRANGVAVHNPYSRDSKLLCKWILLFCHKPSICVKSSLLTGKWQEKEDLLRLHCLPVDFLCKSCITCSKNPSKCKEEAHSNINVASYWPLPCSTAEFILPWIPAISYFTWHLGRLLEGKNSGTLKRMLKVQTPSNRDLRLRSKSYRCQYKSECLLWNLCELFMLLI